MEKTGSTSLAAGVVALLILPPTLIVPGHGRPGGAELLTHTTRLR